VKSEAAAVRKELLAQVDPKDLVTATAVLESLQRVIDSIP